MARVKQTAFPCDECPWSGFAQTALDDHKAHAHPIAGSGGGPAVASAPPAASPAPPEPAEASPAPEPATQAEPDRLAAVEAMVNPVLRVPVADDTFWVDDRVTRLIHTVGMISADGEIVNVLLTGPKGTGKTSLPQEFAAAVERPFLNVHCALVAELARHVMGSARPR